MNIRVKLHKSLAQVTHREFSPSGFAVLFGPKDTNLLAGTTSLPELTRQRDQGTWKENEKRARSHKRDTLPFSENKSPCAQSPGDSFREVAMTTQSV